MANTATPSPAKPKAKAVHVIHRDNTVLSVFCKLKTNEKGRSWKSYYISLQRSYYDVKNDERKYTDFLSDTDLLNAAQSLTEADQFIQEDRRKTDAEVAEAEQAAEAVA